MYIKTLGNVSFLVLDLEKCIIPLSQITHIVVRDGKAAIHCINQGTRNLDSGLTTQFLELFLIKEDVDESQTQTL